MQEVNTRKVVAHVQILPDEDKRLCSLVEQHGVSDWNLISTLMRGRNARQCRDRWINYLDKSVNRNSWSQHEDAILLQKYGEHGPKWKYLETFLPGRRSYSIRNRLHSLKHRLEQLMRRSKESTVPMPIIDNVSDSTTSGLETKPDTWLDGSGPICEGFDDPSSWSWDFNDSMDSFWL